jgi:hypothetical protein
MEDKSTRKKSPREELPPNHKKTLADWPLSTDLVVSFVFWRTNLIWSSSYLQDVEYISVFYSLSRKRVPLTQFVADKSLDRGSVKQSNSDG